MALAAARNTQQKADATRAPVAFKQKGSTTIYAGSLVALNGGYAAPGATATARVAVGRAKKTTIVAGADGTAVTDASGAVVPGSPYIEVEEGIFKWANSGSDAVVAADVGALVYIEDDQTVSHTATGKSAAGRCVQLDSDGVWVRTGLGVA
jgi:hypothetical protein